MSSQFTVFSPQTLQVLRSLTLLSVHIWAGFLLILLYSRKLALFNFPGPIPEKIPSYVYGSHSLTGGYPHAPVSMASLVASVASLLHPLQHGDLSSSPTSDVMMPFWSPGHAGGTPSFFVPSSWVVSMAVIFSCSLFGWFFIYLVFGFSPTLTGPLPE